MQQRERHGGWYVGGGVDWALSPGWILGVEYRHYAFEDKVHVPYIGGVLSPLNSHAIDADADVLTVRLSYKIGRPYESLK